MNKPDVQLSDEPPPLTEAYHKARRSYVLFSGLLMAWALIGFDVAEVPLENVKVTVKSPQAVPFVLLILICYFSSRTVQERFQCDSHRHENGWAMSDFWSAHIIATTTILICFIQWLIAQQLADLVTYNDAKVFVFSGAFTLCGVHLYNVFKTHFAETSLFAVIVDVVSCATAGYFIISTFSSLWNQRWMAIVIATCSAFLGSYCGFILKRLPRISVSIDASAGSRR
jgi:hypothetical protein